MAETLTIVSERVDDIPVLLAHLARLGLQPLLDAHFPTHGNWVGLSLGWVSVLWLTHILLRGRPSAQPRRPLGQTAASHAAGQHRALRAPVRRQRRPVGDRDRGLQRRYALERL